MKLDLDLNTPTGITMVIYNGYTEKNKAFAGAMANSYKLNMYYLTLHDFIKGSIDLFKLRLQDCMKNFDKPTNMIYIDDAEALFQNTYDLLSEQKLDLLTTFLKNAIPPIVLNLKQYPETKNHFIKRLNIASKVNANKIIIPHHP